MNILHIDSSILGDHSTTRQLTAAIAARLQAAAPGAAACRRAVMAAVSWRVVEWSPRMLESICRIFMGGLVG